MKDARPTDYGLQNSLVHVLAENMRTQSEQSRLRLLETHISWVLLAGRYAYKIKKAVNLGFLNFSSLEARHYYCKEEIRLNRRLAPEIYLDVITIGGSEENPVFGELPAIEYAVRMRRFPLSRQLDKLAAKDKLLPQHIDSLAATIAKFHRDLPASDVKETYGTAESVSGDIAQNFEQLHELLKERADLDRLAVLRRASENEYAVCHRMLQQRVEQGYIRECHGDLHLGNIVLIGGQPVPFDGIEFNPALRWIDVISEIAFTVMDLLYHKRSDLAFRFLNAYLENTGDYAGIPLLRLYTAYRAMVRAKVSAIRSAQHGLPHLGASKALATCRAYLELAADCYIGKKPVLIITHGLPGSGKSTFAQMALERLRAIRLRSDVERKRLYGLGPLADSHALGGIDLYSAEVTRQAYAQLNVLARELLLAGYTVIVDAAFVTLNERTQFRQLADELSVPFVIAAVYASKETLRDRIMKRQQAANDASEADIAVMEKLMLSHDPLTPAERGHTAEFRNEGGGIVADEAGWSRLEQLLD